MVEETNVSPKVYRMDSIKKRISGLKIMIRRNASVENLQKSMGPRGSKSGGPAEDSEDEDLDRLPRQSRQRALRENSVEIPITEQMLDDLENGEFWRGMQGARKRVRGILHTATGNKQES